MKRELLMIYTISHGDVGLNIVLGCIACAARLAWIGRRLADAVEVSAVSLAAGRPMVPCAMYTQREHNSMRSERLLRSLTCQNELASKTLLVAF